MVDAETVVQRVERAMAAASRNTPDGDLLLDSVALGMHDFYAGLERAFEHLASSIDKSLPSGSDWHRELLRQMALDVPGLRPPVLASPTLHAVDEYLRFRHVVRNVYAFTLDPDRLADLVRRLRPAFEQTKADLLAFAQFLEQVSTEPDPPA
ncbi:MAG: ribonuclease toxin HepT-like protein [Thermoleophilia bacterium]